VKLILEKITKAFPGRKVFRDISIEVNKGETLVITGPNGSGKTTLIKIIGSLLLPTSGKVRFNYNGKDLTGSDILPYIGLVTQELFVYNELTAFENLNFFAEVSGLTVADFESRLAQFGLKGRGDDLVGSYSSGMKQRLKYILALMRDPPLLLLDEPASNLDDQGKSMVGDIIKSHNGITVVATNEQEDLEYVNHTIRLGE
jgi:heme exporter protein A